MPNQNVKPFGLVSSHSLSRTTKANLLISFNIVEHHCELNPEPMSSREYSVQIADLI